jgi:hypothetical protein
MHARDVLGWSRHRSVAAAASVQSGGALFSALSWRAQLTPVGAQPRPTAAGIENESAPGGGGLELY